VIALAFLLRATSSATSTFRGLASVRFDSGTDTLGGPRPDGCRRPVGFRPYRLRRRSAPPACSSHRLRSGLPSRYMARRQSDLMESILPPTTPARSIPLPISPYACATFTIQHRPTRIAPDGFAYPSHRFHIACRAFVEPFRGRHLILNFNNPIQTNPELTTRRVAFAAATGRLTMRLSPSENGDVWIEYLQCGRLADFFFFLPPPAPPPRSVRPICRRKFDIRNLAAKYQASMPIPIWAWLMRRRGFKKHFPAASVRDHQTPAAANSSPSHTPEPARSYSPPVDSTPSDRLIRFSEVFWRNSFNLPAGVTTVCTESESAPLEESQSGGACPLPSPNPSSL